MKSKNKSIVFSMHTKQCFKIIVVGNKFAGKTSLIIRFVKGVFELNYKVTVGVQFYSKIVEDQDEQLALQIWDTAGSENYKSVVRSFYNFAHCVLIVYESLKDLNQSIQNWMKQVKQNALQASRLVLVRTKIDINPLEEQQKKIVQQLIKKYSIDFFMAVSAKSNENVNDLFTKIGAHLNELFKTNQDFRKIAQHKNQTILLSKDELQKDQNNKSQRKKCCKN